jgi:hypothetical protein
MKKEKNMRRLRVAGIIAAVLLASVFALPSFADSIPILSIDPVSSSGASGSNVTLDINISNVTDLDAFQFDLSFAPGTVAALSIAEGAFLSGAGATFFIPGTIDNVGGTVASTADTLLGPGPGVDGSGTLAILTLTGLAPGTSAIDLSNVFLLDSNLNSIDASLQSGSVTVSSPTTPVPEPNTLVLLMSGVGVFIFLRRK